MAFTSADLDALDRAIASGELSVKFSDREVTYRDVASLKSARNFVQQKIAEQNGHRRTRQVRVTVGKGV